MTTNLNFENAYGIFNPFTLLELNIDKISAIIRDKPNWETKIEDINIRNNWRKELLSTTELQNSDIDYIFDELQYYKLSNDGLIQRSSVRKTWKADDYIPEILRRQFIDEVNKLKASKSIDYHPWSKNQVIDIIHPSLYPIVNNVSKITHHKLNLKNCGDIFDKSEIKTVKFEKLNIANNNLDDSEILNMSSKKFQWMPAEYDLKTTKFVSYINNLSVQNITLYDILNKIFSLCLPLLNRTLNDIIEVETVFGNEKHFLLDDSKYITSHKISQNITWYEVDEKGETYEFPFDENFLLNESLINYYEKETNRQLYKDLDQDIIYYFGDTKPKEWKKFITAFEKFIVNKFHEIHNIDISHNPDFICGLDSCKRIKVYKPITIGKYIPPSAKNYVFEDVLSKYNNLQVIVKIADIYLKPGDSEFVSNWHIEGVYNEHIVATCIYYYRSENIKGDELSFRLGVDEPENYEQYDWTGVEKVYGLKQNEQSNQILGKISTKQGRLICFPNIYQHKAMNVALNDTAKPGIRRLLVFFVIDPNHRIISSENIPVQQKEFYDSDKNNVQIVKESDALKYRLELMEERKYIIDQTNDEFYEREVSLCEH